MDGTASVWHWGAAPRGDAVALISLYDTENNAVRQLAAALRKQGRRTLEIYFKDWLNNRFEEPTQVELEHLFRILRDEGAGLVGLSVRASAYEQVARRIGKLIRSRTGLPIVAGGWHVTVRPDDCLDFADALCIGEADHSFPRFVQSFFGGDAQQVLASPGFWLHHQGEVRRNPELPLVVDLDSLPWRDYSSPDKWFIHRRSVTRGDPMEHDPLHQVMCSIGCIQKCSFCHNSFEGGAAGPRLRTRSVSSVIDELNARRQVVPIRRVRFDDEIFGIDHRWLEEFAERWPREVGLPFDVLTEPTVVTDSYARLLGQAGCQFVHIGIQSTESVNREKLARRATRELTRGAVQRLTLHRIRIRYLVMIDIPGVSEESHAELFSFFQSVPQPYELYLFSLTFFPGSRMVEDMLAAGELSADEVEGRARKTFSQYRVDLGHPRPPADAWWLALFVLQSSQLVPRPVLDLLVRQRVLRDDPRSLSTVAHVATLGKTARVAARMLRNGELTPTLVRRWWNPTALITM